MCLVAKNMSCFSKALGFVSLDAKREVGRTPSEKSGENQYQAQITPRGLWADKS